MNKFVISITLAAVLQASSYENRLELGAKSTFYNYTERDDNNNILDTEESSLFDIGGIYASYDHKLKEIQTEDGSIANYLNIYTSLSAGNSDYIGSSLIYGLGYGSVTNTTFNTFYEFQVNLKRIKYYKASSIFIQFGLGYKEWKRKLSTSQLETYHYNFAQITAGGEKTIYKDWSLGLELTSQLGFDTEMDTDFSETTQTNPLNETFNLGAVYTYKLAVPLTIPIDKQFSFTTRAEYEFTSYGKSNIITKTNFFKPGFEQNGSPDANLLEPDSQQKNWHFYAGLQYIF